MMVGPSVDLMATWTALEIIAAQQVKAWVCVRVRAKRIIRTIDCRGPRACGKTGYADFKQGRLLAELALQPAHEPYRHAHSSHAAKYCRSRAGFSPILYLCIEVFAHCRLSEQEIKRYLWAGRPHFVDCRLSRRARSSLETDCRRQSRRPTTGRPLSRHLDGSTAASARNPAQAR